MQKAITSRFRSAVAARQWTEAQELLAEMSNEAQALWETASSDERKDLAREIEATLGWAQKTVIAARAQDELKRIHLVRRSAYLPNNGNPSHVTLEV